MKKGLAVEGFIREDGCVGPIQGYDDTELREKIQKNTDAIDNLDSRVDALEDTTEELESVVETLGGPSPSFVIRKNTLEVEEEDIESLTSFVKKYHGYGAQPCDVRFITSVIGTNSTGGYNHNAIALVWEPAPGILNAYIHVAVGSILYILLFYHDGDFEEITFENAWTKEIRDIDTIPTADSNNFITSGAVKTALDGKAASAHTHTKINAPGAFANYAYAEMRHVGADKPYLFIKVGGSYDMSAQANITVDNIGNLNRALATPSSTPENNSDKLITSKAVYDALAGKANSIKTLGLSHDTYNDIFSPTQGDKVLMSAFIEEVPENQLVPVIVKLSEGAHDDGEVIGVAKWYTSENQQEELVNVEVTIGNKLFRATDYDVSSMDEWTRTSVGQSFFAS